MLEACIYDARWIGEHGIGRFAHEVRVRLPEDTFDIPGSDPVSLRGLLELEVQSGLVRRPGRQVFFSPGYAPPVSWRGPLIFTIHDLIHLDVAAEASRFKTLYYNRVVRPAVARAQAVLTVSEYSRQRILDWSGAPPEKVVVVGNGVDGAFSPQGPKYNPGYPYVLYVRNTKPHKNVPRLLEAFARLDVPEVKLVLSGRADEDTRHLALRLGILDRVVFAGRIPEADLPSYYRGAAVVTMPSLYEGFGLPALEGMACGVPVVVSNTTSLPEVVGDAGVLVDPTDADSIAEGLCRALTDTALRADLRERGLIRARRFDWDRVGARVRRELM
ncbi:glycosyltransferase family 1 protein [Deinococcus aluminii]|uniref:D-inositol-3-phosphate glycosyltransferase n=1 Tax=Deinococcus aluminii TaxID=1656885 RepID=A0ABP9XJV1_9DEIO